jgi:hypothetical protein
LNCTFTGNEAGAGGGICCHLSSSSDVVNTILWGNKASSGPEIWIGDAGNPSILTISYSDVEGGPLNAHIETGCTLDCGEGMIVSDPLFADPDDSDFHLIFNSPCRGSGDNAAPELPDHDFEGDLRIFQGTVDIGADEFHPHLYCTGDFTPGGSIMGKLVGFPGASPVGLFIGSGILEPSQPTMWGHFHLQQPWIMVSLVPIPSDGILVLPATIPFTPSSPYDLPMQALIGLNPDSLTNLYVLEVR